jgi:general secretion pathway protein A
MYNEYFGFKESPFSIAPDPRYLYMSEQHREALAHLIYGFNSDGGFVLLTGEVGTGKTSVCRCLLEQVPENTSIAFILNPKLTVEELLATICDEFGIQYPRRNSSIKVFVDLINTYLLDAHAKGQKAVLIIDEAQNLSVDVLEQLRLLTNLETNQRKLLQIILLGQPELREKLSRPELRQLSQRIIARYHLRPLSKKEVGAYVTHRLSVAGIKDQLFPESTLDKLYRLSGGVPRVINMLCDRALLGTYTQGKSQVSKSTLKKAAREIFGKTNRPEIYSYKKIALWLLPISMFIVGIVLAATYYEAKQDTTKQLLKPAPVVQEQYGDLLWPDDQPVNKSKDMAFQELLKIWGLSFQPDKNIDPCQYAVVKGLQCYNALGNLNSLRLLNRPAILKLYDEQGREFYVTLTALKEESAIIMIGEEAREVSLSEIEGRWLGDYTILWKMPPDYSGIIQPGTQSPMVQWLDNQLAKIYNRVSRERENILYDDDLVRQVKKFQISRGLIPDGIVGAQTLIHINSAAGIETPRLINKRKDN